MSTQNKIKKEVESFLKSNKAYSKLISSQNTPTNSTQDKQKMNKQSTLPNNSLLKSNTITQGTNISSIPPTVSATASHSFNPLNNISNNTSINFSKLSKQTFIINPSSVSSLGSNSSNNSKKNSLFTSTVSTTANTNLNRGKTKKISIKLFNSDNKKVSILSSGSNSTPAIVRNSNIFDNNNNKLVNSQINKEIKEIKEEIKKQISSFKEIKEKDKDIKEIFSRQKTTNSLSNYNINNNVPINCNASNNGLLLSTKSIKKHKQTNSNSNIHQSGINPAVKVYSLQNKATSKLGSNSNISPTIAAQGVNKRINPSNNQLSNSKTKESINSNNVKNKSTEKATNKVEVKNVIKSQSNSKSKSKDKQNNSIKAQNSEETLLKSIKYIGMMINSHMTSKKIIDHNQREVNKSILNSLLNNIRTKDKLLPNEDTLILRKISKEKSENGLISISKKNSDFLYDDEKSINIDLNNYEEKLEKVDFSKVNLKKQTFIGSCDVKYRDKFNDNLFKIEEESIFAKEKDSISHIKITQPKEYKDMKIELESEDRLKKYNILFQFINQNVKEITELVNSPIKEKRKKNLRIETDIEVNNKKRLPYEDAYSTNIVNFPVIKGYDEISKSFICSSINNDDFYKNLFFEDKNLYNSVSSFKTIEINSIKPSEEIYNIPYFIHTSTNPSNLLRKSENDRYIPQQEYERKKSSQKSDKTINQFSDESSASSSTLKEQEDGGQNKKGVINNFKEAKLQTKQDAHDDTDEINTNEEYCKDILNEISLSCSCSIKKSNSNGSHKPKKAKHQKRFNNSRGSKKTIINISNKNFVNYTTQNVNVVDEAKIKDKGDKNEPEIKDDKNCLIF